MLIAEVGITLGGFLLVLLVLVVLVVLLRH